MTVVVVVGLFFHFCLQLIAISHVLHLTYYLSIINLVKCPELEKTHYQFVQFLFCCLYCPERLMNLGQFHGHMHDADTGMVLVVPHGRPKQVLQ